MSVLVKGMEKPEHCGYCRFRYDGICHALQKTQYNMNECPLVAIDDAGLNDTISRQAAIDVIKGIDSYFVKYIEALPSAQKERKKDIIQKFHDYQVEWLTSHSDLEVEPVLESWVVHFLHDTANCYMMEMEHD